MMNKDTGFFSLAETESKTRPGGKNFTCASCGLYKTAHTPRMEPFGDFDKKIMVIGDFPSERDDNRGQYWTDHGGSILRREFKRNHIDLDIDCISIYAISCCVIEDQSQRNPTIKEIQSCRSRVLQTIERYKPRTIVLVGEYALHSLIGHVYKKDLGSIAKWRGLHIPDKQYNAWICPIHSPDYIEKQDALEYQTIWKEDVKAALETRNMLFPSFSEEIEILETEQKIVANLSDIFINSKSIAIDYETTGLKPHDTKNHKIVCMSICTDYGKVIVFPLPKSNRGKKLLQQILQSEKIGKIAQNLKFEHTWTFNILGYEIKNWVWDTMLATHILDNRPDITGLKFQTYAQFGIAGYEEETNSYIKSADPKNSNSTNKILELKEGTPLWRKLLKYCGKDSLYTYKLAMMQMEKIGLNPLVKG